MIDKCPCENCIVFACCNARVKEEDTTKMVIMGLSSECKILYMYLVKDSVLGLTFATRNINVTRRVFGWKSIREWRDEP